MRSNSVPDRHGFVEIVGGMVLSSGARVVRPRPASDARKAVCKVETPLTFVVGPGGRSEVPQSSVTWTQDALLVHVPWRVPRKSARGKPCQITPARHACIYQPARIPALHRCSPDAGPAPEDGRTAQSALGRPVGATSPHLPRHAVPNNPHPPRHHIPQPVPPTCAEYPARPVLPSGLMSTLRRGPERSGHRAPRTAPGSPQTGGPRHRPSSTTKRTQFHTTGTTHSRTTKRTQFRVAPELQSPPGVAPASHRHAYGCGVRGTSGMRLRYRDDLAACGHA
jgi:hypothetical protein